jgi:spore germination cell wall hydrolase CwlJ-like protein
VWDARRVILERLDVTLANAVIWGFSVDPTDGATHYHADYVRPTWAVELRCTCRIGRHLFYRERKPEDPEAATVELGR